MLRTAVDFLRDAFRAGELKSSRGYVDVFADRMTRALTEPTLARAMEQLLRSINAQGDMLHPPLAVKMIALSGSPDASRVIAWLREHTKLAALLAATKDERLIEETLAGITPPDIAFSGGAAVGAGGFGIGIHAVCLSPLAHGADGKAGNATLFRRAQVISSNGAVLSLPFYAGNAVRGQVRDLLADHLLRALGVSRPGLADSSVSLWFFYALFSGGALEESSAALKAITKRLGDNGALRTEGIREFRNMLPGLSLLGCALGNRVLNGRCQIADLRPACAEWSTGTLPAEQLMTWEFLTRREDLESHDENHSMIANTECLKAGAELIGGCDVEGGSTELEKAALGRGLDLLKARGMLGAENRRGFGRVAITLTDAPDPAPYDEYLAAKREEIRAYLLDVGAIEKAAGPRAVPA